MKDLTNEIKLLDEARNNHLVSLLLCVSSAFISGVAGLNTVFGSLIFTCSCILGLTTILFAIDWLKYSKIISKENGGIL